MKAIKLLVISLFALAGTTLFAGELAIKTNMTCESCKTMISEKLDKAEGIDEYTVDLATNTVTVKFDDEKTSEASITKTIADLGFAADKTEAAADGKKACGTKKSCCTSKKDAKK